MAANDLKRMAERYIADRNGHDGDRERIAALEAEIAALRKAIPAEQPTEAEIDAAVKAADDEKEALKARYAELTGSRPRGNPSLETLRQMVDEAAA